VGNVEPTMFFTIIVIILLSLAVHEYAHAKLADVAGDPTPRVYGRVTLNPIAHLDPAGTIMILLSAMSGFGIGWGKPVPVNPSRMRNPRWDHFVSVAGGPLSNLLLAAVAALALRFYLASGVVVSGGQLPFPILFLTLAVLINLSLCFFNLIPLGPLDGHWMLGTFMSEPTRLRWYLWNRQVGGFVLLVVVIGGQMLPEYSILSKVLMPIVDATFRFFTGIDL
jgi:Zn-dependent protease